LEQYCCLDAIVVVVVIIDHTFRQLPLFPTH
jgi:hypothetical protein